MRSGQVITEIVAERSRQETLVATGKFAWTCADPSIGDGDKLAVLVEEVGEVGKELCERAVNPTGWRQRLRTELVQTAAVAVAWIEALDELAELLPAKCAVCGDDIEGEVADPRARYMLHVGCALDPDGVEAPA